MTDEVTTPVTETPPGATVVTEIPTPPSPGEQPALTPDPGAEPAKKTSGVQKRINELTAQIREAQRREERLLGLVETTTRGKPPVEEPPKPENFQNLNEYIDAAVEFKLRQSNPGQHVQRETSSQDGAEFEAARDDLVSEGTEKYEDFAEILEGGRSISKIMANAILESDNRVDVAHFIATNHKEAARISKLSPVRQVAEITRLDDKFSAKPIPPKKPSAAPAPVEPVGGIASPATDISKITDTGEFIKKRQEQLYKGRQFR